MSKIVVGVDGSSQSAKALRWAVDYAKPTDTIVAAHAWQLPVMETDGVPAYRIDDVETKAKKLAEDVVATVVRDGGEGPRVETLVENGHSGRVLIDASDDADLLVVGSRGRGGFVGLLLGSVSTYVVHHARCPVVVLPDRDKDDD